MSLAFAMLAHNGKIVAASLSAKHKAFECSKVFTIMRCLLNNTVRSTVLSRCELWATACSLVFGPELKVMMEI